ncbi:MAG: class I SAM-dependent methyltransferase, partial [Dehalococcoidia bacterium]
YPAGLINDIVTMSSVSQDSHVLEIGCGTGIATRLLAPHGFHITSLDPAAGMLEVARRRCADYPNVTFVQATFEEFEPEHAFDLAVSAQAFHWVDADTGYPRLGSVLSNGGAAALFWSFPQPEETPLRAELDRAYRKHAPDLRSPSPGVGWSRAGDMINGTGMFGPVEVREYPWHASYDTESWITLLGTHSDHRVLPLRQRTSLFEAVRDAINRAGGVYSMHVVTRLYFARRTA